MIENRRKYDFWILFILFLILSIMMALADVKGQTLSGSVKTFFEWLFSEIKLPEFIPKIQSDILNYFDFAIVVRNDILSGVYLWVIIILLGMLAFEISNYVRWF